jgi:hypothetical protein
MKFKCAWCGKEVDIESEEANWYENQTEFINENDEYEVWAKVQHLGCCDEVNYLIFKGKLTEVVKRYP